MPRVPQRLALRPSAVMPFTRSCFLPSVPVPTWTPSIRYIRSVPSPNSPAAKPRSLNVATGFHSFRPQCHHRIHSQRPSDWEPARKQRYGEQQARNRGKHPRQIADLVGLHVIALKLITEYLDLMNQSAA